MDIFKMFTVLMLHLFKHVVSKLVLFLLLNTKDSKLKKMKTNKQANNSKDFYRIIFVTAIDVTFFLNIVLNILYL